MCCVGGSAGPKSQYKRTRPANHGVDEARSQLTPGVGLMTTVGGSLVLLPPLGLEAPPMEPKRSGTPPCWVTLARLDGWLGATWSAPMPVLLGGSGLLRISLSVEDDEDGVRTGDWLVGSREDGDDVPSLESLFFLEDLLASLPRESCALGNWPPVSFCARESVRRFSKQGQAQARWRKGAADAGTYNSLTEPLHLG